ncbi:MAG: hypothetical protein ACRENC_06965 [Gemmatimonadaceae bacterium]
MSNTVPLASSPMPSSAQANNKKKWIAAVIVAFILGFLLGWFLHKCPSKDKNPLDVGTGTAKVGGAPADGGGGAKIQTAGGGAGAGGGGGGGQGGDINGSGSPHSGPTGDADDKTGGDAPDGKPADGQYTPGPPASGSPVAGNVVTQMAAGNLSPGTGEAPPSKDSLNHKGVLTAADFSYDSTGLPRYSSGVQSVASGISTDSVKHTKATLAAIVTNDPFDSVVTWYKSQLPAGWKSSSMGNMEATAKALSPDAIMGMITGASSGKGIDTTALKAGQSSNDGTSIAIMSPPNQTADTRSIMIVRRQGEPTKVMMSKKLPQSP